MTLATIGYHFGWQGTMVQHAIILKKKKLSYKLWGYYTHIFRHFQGNSKEQTKITTDQQGIKFPPIKTFEFLKSDQ